MPTVQTENPHNFEKVWAIIERVAERQEETDRQMKETDRQMKETDRQMKETDRQIKETDRQMKETDRQMKETDRILSEKASLLNAQIGSLTNLFGDFTLGMVAPKLREKFMDFGLVFPKTSPNVYINDTKNKISLEIDMLLENGEKAMLVEVKTKLTEDRISKHVNRLEKMRKYADLHGDKRVFLGAVAGFAITDEVRTAALNQGFYLIEPDGENFNITPPGGKPKEW